MPDVAKWWSVTCPACPTTLRVELDELTHGLLGKPWCEKVFVSVTCPTHGSFWMMIKKSGDDAVRSH